MCKNLLLVFFSLLCGIGLAQNSDSNASQIALDHLNANLETWNLQADDVNQMRITDQYTSKHNGVTHIYFIQQYNGTDVSYARYNANILNGEILSASHSLVSDISSKASKESYTLSADQAVNKMIGLLGSSVRGPLSLKSQSSAKSMVFEKGQNSYLDIPVRLVYSKVTKDNYALAWDITIDPIAGNDLMNMHIDATSGKVLDELSLTVHCSFPDDYLGHQHECKAEQPHRTVEQTNVTSSGDGAKYNVVPIPFESPNHAERRMVTEPANTTASPFGWHDLDGVDGAETTVTTGNNVEAFVDRNGDYTPNGAVADGGDDLLFDFPFDKTKEPVDYQEASVTNLFYMNNVIHDVTYNYGFDEFSGNFQSKNYTGVGAENDNVIALSQFDVVNEENNADFSTPGDGGSGRMRMFLWSGAGANSLLTVEEPAQIAGTFNTSTTVDWGVAITSVPLTGLVAIVDDETSQETQGCYEVKNGDEIDGKIALIDRGNCDFSEKAYNAQTAGAIGFIICNFEEGLINMSGGDFATEVNIPGIFISNSDCQRIRVYVEDGLTVSLVNQSDTSSVNKIAGDYDNGIVAHEYAHGISNRLTGGPSFTGCLRNYDLDNDAEGTREEGEQMGEGWSDFFGLILTVKPGDTGDKIRGVGTYAQGQDTSGVGIRPFAYSTDMGINPMTYDDIAFNSVPHGVGSVWCTMIWDLYWALTDEYGFDEDVYHGTGGNNLAIQLVMDGMKLQPCNPGFADARDGILSADIALTGGANQNLIWTVFARRGLGYSADQGEEMRRSDGSEAFDVDPLTVKTVKLKKEMTPTITAGDLINVSLSVYNHKDEPATEVMLSDIVPDGTYIVNGSSSHPFDQQGDMVTFDLSTIAAGDTIEVTYELATALNLLSDRLFYDDMEDGDSNWDLILEEGSEFWQLQSFIVNSGESAWGLANVAEESDVSLITFNETELSGEQPILSFYHNYDTEKFFDTGILQTSIDDGFTWLNVPDASMIRQGYSSKIPYGAFAIPNIRGWNGNSGDWKVTMVDLAAYKGENIKFRWRFGSDDNANETGWFLDDVEVMDAFNYNSESCITSAEGDDACAEASEWGTVVESGVFSSADDVVEAVEDLNVYPNPATDFVTVEINSSKAQRVTIELISANGQTIWGSDFNVQDGFKTNISTKSFPRGFYFVRVMNETENSVVKLILN